MVPGAGPWRRQLDAADLAWGGAGSELPATLAETEHPLVLPPYAVAVYAADLFAGSPHSEALP